MSFVAHPYGAWSDVAVSNASGGRLKIWPPARACSSTTSTSSPARAADSAPAIPAGPAPTTNTSTIKMPHTSSTTAHLWLRLNSYASDVSHFRRSPHSQNRCPYYTVGHEVYSAVSHQKLPRRLPIALPLQSHLHRR